MVADLPSGLSDLTIAVLEDSSSIVLVLTPDLLGLRRARRGGQDAPLRWDRHQPGPRGAQSGGRGGRLAEGRRAGARGARR